MPFFEFDQSNSIEVASGDAFHPVTGNEPSIAIIDAHGFLISDASGDGMHLDDTTWDITVRGQVTAHGVSGYGIELNTSTSIFSTIIVGKTGQIAGTLSGIFATYATNITNHGIISSDGTAVAESAFSDATIHNVGTIQGPTGLLIGGTATLTIVNSGTIDAVDFSIDAGYNLFTTVHAINSGHLVGDIRLTGNDDSFKDFVKHNGIIKSGTVKGTIDFGDGTDTFIGGAHAEKLIDGNGSDTVKLGGGNDTYLAVKIGGGTDGTDTIAGGKGRDTYDASLASSTVGINLDKVGHGLVFSALTAFGGNVGSDHITGFENAIGGSGNDFLFGTSGANLLNGGSGSDHIAGLGGRDVLTGAGNDDTFIFFKLSDSGVKASTRDLITDFSQSDADQIDLSPIDANGHAAGEGTFSFIGTDQFGGTRGELRESFSNGNTIVSGDVNGDGNADFRIALAGHILLGSGDFNL
jgi:Ca2+-binding RTX toxin-like protein